MANDNKNTNELVADDTAELEAVTFRQGHPDTDLPAESDDNTFDFDDHPTRESQTIRKLRYDIERLRSKWIGLEAELVAREEITETLNAELADVRASLARKDKLLKTRDHKLKALKAEIRDREEHHRASTADLQQQLDVARKSMRDIPAPPDSKGAGHESPEDKSRLARTEEYADILRRKMQDLLARQDVVEKENSRLNAALARADERARAVEADLIALTSEKQELEEQLAGIAARHADEIRMLRFELGEAQETVAQTEELNSQLASDLVDTRGFKEELERMLCNNDEQSRHRIDALEAEVARLSRSNAELGDKLDARSEAINVLLGELAKKTEQLESIGEIGDVISEIDDRITEQFEEPGGTPPPSVRAQDRVTRVLLGKVGDKLLRFPLFKDKLTIGRTSENDIQLDAPYISRRHAVVTTDGETTRVIDWGSRNGVFVNSKRITEHFLANGDIVTIGNAHFRYDERPKRDV
ncbi:MAG TPA: FHA domain-containing protein [Woeseiaceae bacterium]|jgi:chromosome segregation ATPase|nr:FHA domain-containing protein [Woeseiaceae bacterium]